MQMFEKDLDSVRITYLREHNLISIASVLYLYKQTCVINKHFNNLTYARQIKMIYAILEEKETYLHTLLSYV